MRKLIRLYVDLHAESNLDAILSRLQDCLIELKHQKGEINSFEMRDEANGVDRRLRSR